MVAWVGNLRLGRCCSCTNPRGVGVHDLSSAYVWFVSLPACDEIVPFLSSVRLGFGHLRGGCERVFDRRCGSGVHGMDGAPLVPPPRCGCGSRSGSGSGCGCGCGCGTLLPTWVGLVVGRMDDRMGDVSSPTYDLHRPWGVPPGRMDTDGPSRRGPPTPTPHPSSAFHDARSPCSGMFDRSFRHFGSDRLRGGPPPSPVRRHPPSLSPSHGKRPPHPFPSLWGVPFSHPFPHGHKARTDGSGGRSRRISHSPLDRTDPREGRREETGGFEPRPHPLLDGWDRRTPLLPGSHCCPRTNEAPPSTPRPQPTCEKERQGRDRIHVGSLEEEDASNDPLEVEPKADETQAKISPGRHAIVRSIQTSS